MKALILAAGRGTRVRPITNTLPKPMIPILNRPTMEIILNHIVRYGFNEVMVNTSYLSTAIQSYFGDGQRSGASMAYSFEGHCEGGCLVDEPVGSAGAIRRIHDQSGFFDETFLVVCGDTLADVDLGKMLDIHRRSGGLATIALTQVARERVSSYGVVRTDQAGRILEFQEKPAVADAKSTSINAGVYLFEPEAIEFIPSEAPYDIGGQLFPALVASDRGMYGSSLPFQWLDIGNVGDYHRVTQMALRGEVNGIEPPGKIIAPGVRVGLNVRVDPQAVLVPPVYIGGSSFVEAGARIIGPTAIGANCRIGGGVLVERSVVLDYTRVGRYADLRDMIASGEFCLTSDGSQVVVQESDLGWAVSDSRVDVDGIFDHHRGFLDALFDAMIGAAPSAVSGTR